MKGWALETKYTAGYCGFKAGFFNAFGVKWMGSKTIAFFVKISSQEATKTQPKMTKYSNDWNEAYYYIVPEKTKTNDYIRLFEVAYKKFTG